MELRPLGRSGMTVSALAIGTVTWGRNTGLAYAAPRDLPRDADLAALLDRAEAHGINLLDTAPAYGVSEQRIGILLRGRTHPWRIATKVGESFDGMTSNFDFSRRAVQKSVGRSLRALRREHLDIVTIHSDGAEEGEAKFGPAADALARLRDQGTIGAIGFSAKTLDGALWAAIRCDAVMLTWNEADRSLKDAVEAARRLRTGVMAKKPLAQGQLPAEALRFVLATAGITCAVVGTANARHLDQAAAIAAETVTSP